MGVLHQSDVTHRLSLALWIGGVTCIAIVGCGGKRAADHSFDTRSVVPTAAAPERTEPDPSEPRDAGWYCVGFERNPTQEACYRSEPDLFKNEASIRALDGKAEMPSRDEIVHHPRAWCYWLLDQDDEKCFATKDVCLAIRNVAYGTPSECTEVGTPESIPEMQRGEFAANPTATDSMAAAPVAAESAATEPELTREELAALCDGGDGGACFRIGVEMTVAVYKEKGESSRQNLAKMWEPGQPYFRRGCELGVEESCAAVLLENGFYCTIADPPHDPVVTYPEGGHCARSLHLCNGVRAALTESRWTTSECLLREQSACYTYRMVLERRTVRECYATFDDCELWRGPTADKAKTSRDIANVTGCKATKK